MKISFDCCANTFSNLDVDNDVVSIDSQMNSMDDNDVAVTSITLVLTVLYNNY